ncbi:hypothetical protein D3C85_1864090 [compost metagenome]
MLEEFFGDRIVQLIFIADFRVVKKFGRNDICFCLFRLVLLRDQFIVSCYKHLLCFRQTEFQAVLSPARCTKSE